MTITAATLQRMLKARYPNADIELLDLEYELPEAALIERAHGQFIFQMRVVGLVRWLKNKLDCDKWSWLFKAYIIVRNALSSRKHAQPVGLICYCIAGDKNRPHAINNFAYVAGPGKRIGEIEPLPGGGRMDLTQEERLSVWRVTV